MSTSPAVSVSTTTSTSRPAGPARNKSSSTLSNHGGTASSSSRPKRNKSSSSLHGAGAGHHQVQFAHHGAKKGKRSGSSSGGNRRGMVDFGFTSIAAVKKDNHNNKEDDETVVGSGSEDDDAREGRGSSTRRASELSDDQPPKQLGSPMQEEEERSRSRSRSRSRGGPQAKDRRQLKPPAPAKVVDLASSVRSTTGSDWESATDSPLAIGRTLPAMTPVEGVSGLAQVMGTGDALLQEDSSAHQGQDVEVEEMPTPSKKGKGVAKPRALFEIADSPPTPPSPAPISETRLPPNAVASPQAPLATTPHPAPPTPTIGDVHPSTPSPPVSRSTSPPPPRPSHSQQQQQPSSSTVAFPTTESPSTSPAVEQPHRPRPPATKRKSSNASVLSISSSRSFAGSTFGTLMGAAPPNLRRSTSGAVVPLVALDRVNVPGGPILDPSNGYRTASGEGRRSGNHQRSESTTSMRSLRSVVESARTSPVQQRRAATIGSAAGRQHQHPSQQQQKQKLAPSVSASALSALGNLRTASPSSPTASKRSSTGGYFASLRSFAQLPSFTPPISPSPSSPSSSTRPSSTRPPSSAHNQQHHQPHKPQSYLIARFLEPPSPLDSGSYSPPSTSPVQTHHHLAGRTLSSANLTLSRTQQKALLARDADHVAASRRGSSVGRGGAGEGGERMQKWAMELVREAERIERQYRAVGKWRDPLGESLERVLGGKDAVVGVVKIGKGKV